MLSPRLTAAPIRISHAVSANDVEPDLAEQPAEHLVKLVWLELDLRASLAVSERAALELLLPFRMVDLSPVLIGLPEARPSEHHQRKTHVMIGDIELGLRYRILGAEPRAQLLLDFRTGIFVPLARVPIDPGLAEGSSQPHEHISFGSGTVDPLAGLQMTVPLDRGLSIAGFAWTRVPLYRGRQGYRAGPRVSAGAGVEYLGSTIGAHFILGFYYEGQSDWASGRIDELSGQVMINVSAAIILFPQSGLPLEIGFVLPVELGGGSSDVHSIGTLNLSLKGSFDLW